MKEQPNNRIQYVKVNDEYDVTETSYCWHRCKAKCVEPGNAVLVMIAVATVLLALHGRTVFKVPRCGLVEFNNEDAVTLPHGGATTLQLLDDLQEIAAWEKMGKVDPKVDEDWEPPCLPEDAPGYKAKGDETTTASDQRVA